MSDPRRIVIDTSSVVPAFFPDADQYINDRSRDLVQRIEYRKVVAFAPETLHAELLKRAIRWRDERRRAGASQVDADDDARQRWWRFQRARIIYTPASELAERALEIAVTGGVSAPDSWFVACAVYHDAELWLSHRHDDRLAEWAERLVEGVRFLSDSADRVD